MKMRAALYLVLAVYCLIAVSAKAQSDHDLALALRSNVVAIEAVWPNGKTRDGFGFVVGQEGRFVYIATARHVLYGAGPEDKAVDIAVRLFRRPAFEAFDAELLPNQAESIDLGVIQVRLDESRVASAWTAEAVAPADQPINFGDPVWFIGRSQEWYVPSSPGSVNHVSGFSRRIYLDNLPVWVGSSGAPLLSRDGIIGMVIRDSSADEAIAVPISAIRLAFEEWNLPWGLIEAGSSSNGSSVAGEVFNDCNDESWCPEMVVVPAGSFKMGSPEGEEGRYGDEGPQHPVTIGEPFAIGVYEVTFDEWDACAANGGCNGYRPNDNGWGRGRRPVINVSWDDAQAYVAWLSDRTGATYRLPSEAEWEYAARAGTTTPFHFGSTISTDVANFDGDFTYGSGQEGVYRQQTVTVGSFPANAFGLHDVHGNVWERVEDCWNGGYAGIGLPDDGTAWATGDCSRRVLRGGSWGSKPRNLRSANRLKHNTEYRVSNSGFRVARTLR